ncbi:MAG: hypothetical protein F4X34_09670 [Chloroflexi bacterium]|nr:hypothetical protein [Chloroflexota bacterium]
MAEAIGEAKRGLAAALASIEGLRVYDYEPDGVHEFPAAIVRLESREPVETLGGGAVRGSMRVEVLAPITDARQADETLGAFLEPQGALSIEAAATADRTWGGTVDDARLVRVDNIGKRKVGGVQCLGADFCFWFVRGE